MKVDSTNSTAFRATIYQSKALDFAINLAKKDIKEGSKDSFARAEKFYNSLKTIENDTEAEYFFIDLNPIHYYPYMKLGKNSRLLEIYEQTEEHIAKAVQDGINKLVDGKYIVKHSDNKNIDLLKSFDRWLSK